jgi:hypothetical protein
LIETQHFQSLRIPNKGELCGIGWYSMSTGSFAVSNPAQLAKAIAKCHKKLLTRSGLIDEYRR